MQIVQTTIPDLLIIEPKVFGDARGFFFESFNEKAFKALTGTAPHFVQDNHSKSSKGVLRGLHYQMTPYAQGKLVRVVQGEVWDVAVDMRHGSTTRGQSFGMLLSAENNRQLWIPEGFAHGFVTLSETAEFLYKTTNYYNPAYERCIAWDDPTLAVDWQLPRLGGLMPQLSARDQLGTPWNQH